MPEQPPFVIAISGNTGSGKTTLVCKVAALLGDAVTLNIDDYEATSRAPADLSAWLAEGADFNRWEIPQLLADLSALKSGTSITLPNGKGVLSPTPFIVLEEPFGREHAQLATLLDFVACVDVALDVSLARKMLRDIEMFFDVRSMEDIKRYLQRYLGWYVGAGRDVYRETNARVMLTCDLVLDGMLAPDVLAEQVVRAVKATRAD